MWRYLLLSVLVVAKVFGQAANTQNLNINVTGGTVATPTYNPIAGAYGSTQNVLISDSTAGAALFYCLDSTNTCTPSASYTGAVSISSTEYLRAQGTLSGYTNSAIASGLYTISGGGGGAGLSTIPGWHKISYSELSGTENTSPCPPNNFGGYGYSFAQNCPAVYNTWSSAVADTLRDRLVIWGGGHTDYSGNELYALDLNQVGVCTSSDPCLYRLNNPSPPNGTGSSDTDSDGRPSSRHTYQGLTYVPAYAPPAITGTVWPSDIMVSVGGSPAPGGNGLQTTWQLAMSSVTGECAPYTGASSGSNAYNNCGTSSETISQWTSTGSVVSGSGPGENFTAVWDPWNQLVQLIDDQYFLESYNTNAKTWSLEYNNLLVAGYNANSAYDDYDQLIFFMGCYSTCSSFWVPTATGSTYAQHNITFDSSCPGATFPMGYPALVWDPIDRAFRILNQSNYSQQYLLYPSTTSSTWVCTTETYGSTQGTDYPPPNNSQLQMIAGKWNYFNNLDVFVFCNDPTADCWYFRPTRPGANFTNTTGSTITNVPVTVAQEFRDGDVSNCANAYIDGTAVTTTQTDIKNQWPDGDLKFGMVSFVIPSIGAGKTVHARFGNQSGCNNTGFATAANLLSTSGSFPSNSGNWNFDGQIQLTGTVNHNLSARTILTAANSGSGCASYSGGDVDGHIATSGNYCTYWLQGPVVTAVILEDRNARDYDVNTDAGSGNPLHPIFEAWFYPQTGQVHLGYMLEDDWASTTATNSARDQTYAYTLTYGNSSPTTTYTQASETVLTRTRWHHMFCTNGTGAGTQNGCEVGSINVDHRWPYLAQTKLFPNWDPDLILSTAATGVAGPAAFYTAWTNASTNKSDAAVVTNGLGFYPGYQTSCGDSNSTTTGDGCSSGGSNSGFGSGGAAYYHGPLTTWDITTLVSQDPHMLNTVTPGSADVSGGVPYWFREADGPTINSHYFNSPGGTTSTLGRMVSINARTQVDLDENGTPGNCATNFAAEYINYAGNGAPVGDTGILGEGGLDTSHWPNTSYVAYMLSGRYNYYEQQVMQGGNAVGNSIGFGPCVASGSTSHRQGAIGYAIYNNDQDREIMWALREMAFGAVAAVDGSPEQTYLLDKMRTNLASIEGSNNITCNITDTANQIAYCGSNSAWTFGNTIRNSYPYIGAVFGTLFSGSTAYVGEGGSCASGTYPPCTAAYSADSNFMNNYTAYTMGFLNDLGYCPHVGGVCPLVQWESNWYVSAAMDPNGPTFYAFGDYVIPTLGTVSQAITNVACLSIPCTVASGSLYPYYGTNQSWPRPSSTFNSGECYDEGYAAEGTAGLSFANLLLSTTNSNQMGTYNGVTGYSGATAYQRVRAALIGSCTTSTFPQQPKWDIVPRVNYGIVTGTTQTWP